MRDIEAEQTRLLMIGRWERNTKKRTLRIQMSNMSGLSSTQPTGTGVRDHEMSAEENVIRRKMKSPTNEEFTSVVEDYELRYHISDCIYDSCVKELSTMKLSQLGDISATRIIRPFLLDWGRMGRVLGSEGPKAICAEIESIANEIEPLRRKDLFSIDLEEKRELIVKLFDRLCGTTFKNRRRKTKRVGPTAASKTLHLVCPDLFVMWDSKIRTKYGRLGIGHDYFEFLEQMREFGKEVRAAIQHLEKKYARRPTKLLDQYNWATREGPS